MAMLYTIRSNKLPSLITRVYNIHETGNSNTTKMYHIKKMKVDSVVFYILERIT